MRHATRRMTAVANGNLLMAAEETEAAETAAAVGRKDG